MLLSNPESLTEAADTTPGTPAEQTPLTEVEQANLATLYAVEPTVTGPEKNSGEIFVERIRTLGQHAHDPVEFGAYIQNNVGETYSDPVSGEITILPRHVTIMDGILADMGQAIGLLKDGGQPDSIQRLVNSAYNNISSLPRMLQNPLQNILLRYYNDAETKD